MPSSTFKDHFSTGSAGYAAFRPTYPFALVEALAAISPGHGCALDCGCGTGQLSILLAERFDRVVATDASAAQIEAAERHPRIAYRAALAEESGLPDESVDLVTVAQAAHWLDLDVFYAEVRRVARPGAIVALITYGVLHVEGPADAAVQAFRGRIAPYWPPERRHVENGYRDLPFPFAEIPLPPLAIAVEWPRDALVGYVRTWSAVKAAERALGEDPVASLDAALREAWSDPAEARRVSFPLTVRAGRVSEIAA